MSIVRDFALARHAQAAPMIGEESLIIGSDTISVVMAMSEHGQDFELGNKATKSLRATCKTSALPATDILKKLATVRGESWRVESVSKGATFTTISLEQETKS